MQNFSNFLNHIENKRQCHGFNNNINNESCVDTSINNSKPNYHTHASDNNLNNTYVNPSSNLTNTNG